MQRILILIPLAFTFLTTNAQTVDPVEIYPGVSQAVAQTVAQAYQPTIRWEGAGTVPEKEPIPLNDEVDTRITFYGGGVSDHRRVNTKNESYKQKNGMLGVGLSTAKSWYGFRPELRWIHVFDNSRKGTTDMKGFGWEWCYEIVLEVCYSRTKAYAKITDNKGNSISQWVPKPIPTLSLGKGSFRVAVTPIDSGTSFVYVGWRKEFNLL